jgi:Ice-binding-like/Bacterial Ig-like domain
MKFKKVVPIIAILLVVLGAGCKKDTENGINPTVTSTDPVDKATGTGISSKITATFSVAMDPSSITITKFTLQQGTATVSGVVTSMGATATFTPTGNLVPNTICTATITGAKDMSGKSLAKDYIWSFTTGAIQDHASPTVTLTDPANNATGVALNHLIVATFSEAMTPATITSSTFTVNQGSTSVAGAVTYTGTTATFTPASNLTGNKIYTVTISTGAKDMAGNALASNYTSSFTTGSVPDNTPPTVSSTDPLNNATDVSRNKAVAITFSEAMNPSTISTSTFTLQHAGIGVSGRVTYSGTIATFAPSTILEAGTTYTATISNAAKDMAGNALAAATYWYFTTGSTTAGLAGVDLGAAGNYLILAETEITNIATSALTGDLGLSPAATSYMTGFALTNATGYATSAQVTGKIYAADMAPPTPINLTTAVNNMLTAYNDAAGRPTPEFSELGTGNIGGKTLTPGLYKWTSTVTIPSDVAISGGPNDVWIFQISGNLTMSSAVKITLSGGAQAKNIFWQVAGEATLGTTSHFEGIILSKTGITFQTGASMNGRALAQTAVILDGNALTKPQ